MIRPQVQFNLAVAKSYFREHLSTGDYYSEGQTIHGEWFGQGAAKLALIGQVSERAFLALCDGKHPETDSRLTQRMKTIRRQNGREALNYRAAVKDAALGKIAQSFDRLDSLDCVREFPPGDRRSILAGEYAAAISRSEKTLVVAQTWDEVDAVNDAIRETLRSQGKIGDGLTLDAFRVADLDSAQKKDVRSYEPGQHAFFLKGYGRFAKGDLCEIRGADENGVVLRKNGRQSTISFRYAERLLVARAAPMEVGPGDRLQLKFNGKSREGLPIANGELVTVRQFGADGNLTVENDARLLQNPHP